MKLRNDWWIFLVSFGLGVLVCYWTLQYNFLEINLEVNVTDVIIALITAIVGIYLAISIQKKFNQGQNLHGYLAVRLDNMWEAYTNFSQSIEYADQIALSESNKYFSEFFKKITVVQRIFSEFDLDDSCVRNLIVDMEAYQEKIENNLTQNNVIQYVLNKTDIIDHGEGLHSRFSNMLKEINKLS